MRVPLSGADIPSTLKRIELDITVAGRKLHETFDGAADQAYAFTWDRRDAYGRLAQGWHDIVAQIGFVYDGVYQKTDRFGYNGNGSQIDGSKTRQEVTFKRSWHDQIGVFDLESRRLGGWSIDVQHTYDPGGKVVYLGTGGRQSAEFVGSIAAKTVPAYIPMGVAIGPNGKLYYADRGDHSVRYVTPDPSRKPFWAHDSIRVAGVGAWSLSGGFSGDNDLAVDAELNGPSDVAFDQAGNMYIADSRNNRVRRVDRQGIITTFAGNGLQSSFQSIDGLLATEAPVCDPSAVAAAPDGSIYIASRLCSEIYRVSTDGRIMRIAGYGIGFGGDGGLASVAQLNSPTDLALSSDGSLYIADTYNHRVRRIDTRGIITTVAGSGPVGSSQGLAAGDGGPATSARLNQPVGLDIQPDGGIYVAERMRVRWISPEGTISSVIGDAGPSGTFLDEGQPLAKTRLANLGGIVVAPDGRLHVATQYPSSSNQPNARILEAQPVLPGFTARDIAVPSADGRELYQFNAIGRHLRTFDTLTGVPLYTFEYDAAGRLTSIADRDGLVTTIARAEDGTATAIVGPYGQRTTLDIDANNHLVAVGNPAHETTQLGYRDDGLLTSLTDPRGGTHRFSYDAEGRLIKDTNPIGGFTTLNRVDNAHGYTVYLANALGDASSVGVQQLASGGQQNISVAPNDATTTSYTKPDGSQVSVDAQGNSTTIVASPDPRWGMQAPFVTSITIRAPNGQAYFTQTARRQATLRDPNNPLSLRSQVDTVTTNGRTTTTSYDGDAHTITTVDPAGLTTKRWLDERGRTIHEQTSNLAPKTYVYDADGRLTSVTEGTGADARTTALDYNAAGAIAGSTDPLGARTSFLYDAAGRVTRQTLPTGHALTFAYDAAGNRTRSTDAAGLATAYGYDLQNRLIATVHDPNGRAVRSEYQYDQADNLLTQVDDAGAGRLNTTTRYTYTPVGRSDYAISSVTNALGQITQLEYTSSGELERTVDPLGHTTVMAYTAQGRLASVTTPDGHTTTTSYDGEGRPIRVTDPRGSTTISSYDALGRLKSVTAGAADVDGQPAPNQITTYDYDLNGRVIRETDALGHASTRAYDAFGRPSTIGDALGNTTSFAYDAMDRLVLQTTSTSANQIAEETAYEYDTAGRPLSTHVDPNGLDLTTRYGYIHPGSANSWDLQTIADPRGNTTAYHLNSVGQRDQTIDALGQVWHFEYDNLGHLTRQVDPQGRATSYTFDAIGRRASQSEDGRTQRWGYNADGTLASATDFAGRTTTFGYDAAGRGIGIDYPAGTPDVSYTRDAAGNITSMVDGLGTTIYAYDPLNRLRTRSRDGRSVGYSYDALGATTQIDYWGHGAATFDYDEIGRLTSLAPWDQDSTSYSYGDNGQLASQTRGNGIRTTYDYDSAGRLIGMLHARGATSLQQLGYQLDANGNRTQLVDNDGATGYSYDALNRMTSASYPSIAGGASAATIPFTFDAAGNRTGAGASSYSYDAANRIGNPGYSYDANGNLLSDGATSYEYDAANRLTKTIKDGVTTTYGYDGNGNLVRETAGGVTTDFVLDERDPLATVVGEIRSDGSELRYAYGPDGVAAQQTSAGASQSTAYPLLDALGSLRHLADEQGALTLSRSYDAFGAIRHTSGAGTTTLGFAGERTGLVDGTIYLRARNYSPALGRFLQRDTFDGTAARPQSLNRYAYAENSPATLTDPSGRCPMCVAAAVGAAVSAGIEYGTQVYGNYQNGQRGMAAFTNVNGGRIAEAAVQGAIAGAVGLVAGPLVGALSKTGLLGSLAASAMEGMASSALGQMALNFIHGCDWNAGLLEALFRGALGGAAGGALGEAVRQGLGRSEVRKFISDGIEKASLRIWKAAAIRKLEDQIAHYGGDASIDKIVRLRILRKEIQRKPEIIRQALISASEEKQALYGAFSPPYVIIQFEDLSAKDFNLRKFLGKWGMRL